MPRVIAVVVGVAAVFIAGFLTGRASVGEDAAEPAVDPDTAALQPGSRSDPVPAGESALVGPWVLQVEGYDPEATESVLAANQFNVEPASEHTYVTVEVVVTRRGSGPGVVRGSLSPTLVNPAGTEYPLGGACGVLGNPVDPGRLLAQDESLVGQWCWQLPLVEIDKVVLRVAGTGGGAVWFDLDDPVQ